MKLTLLQELTAFHGTGKALKKLKPPFFVTIDKDGARWFAGDRSDYGVGYILEGDVNVKNPLDARFDPDAMLRIADAANIEYDMGDGEGPFYCKEIA